MGYRIEIEEIELAISAIEGIKQCAVLYHRVNESYGKIVTFMSISNNDIDAKYIQDSLANILPVYMIPNVFKFYDELPKNANGKIDKNELKNYL